MNTQTEKLPALGIEAFFTRERAHEGVSLPLPGPDGLPSGYHVTIRSTDCDLFRQAQVKRTRENARIFTLPENEQDEARKEADYQLLSVLVAGWDLATDCTPENVILLMRNAAYFEEFVNSKATDRRAIFGKQ